MNRNLSGPDAASLLPSRIFEVVLRDTPGARMQCPDRCSVAPEYLHRTPADAWAKRTADYPENSDPADFMIVACQLDPRERGPVYVRDWSEVHDPQQLPAVIAAERARFRRKDEPTFADRTVARMMDTWLGHDIYQAPLQGTLDPALRARLDAARDRAVQAGEPSTGPEVKPPDKSPEEDPSGSGSNLS